MVARVQVLDQISNQILFECNIDDLELAYKKAREFEEMGLDIIIKAPGLGETLIQSLGATEDEIEKYKKALDAEINSHNDDYLSELGCSICPPSKFKK